jgi:glucan phosphorylase
MRVANLAIVGSHSTNRVAAIHSEWPRTITVKDSAETWPERFCAVDRTTFRVLPVSWRDGKTTRDAAVAEIARRYRQLWAFSQVLASG